MLVAAFQGDQISLYCLGDLFEFGFTQMGAIYLQVDTAYGNDPILRCFCPFFGLLPCSVEDLSAHGIPP